jgi:YggT family protein
MFVLGNVLIGLGVVLQNLLWFYSLVLFARAIVSWVSADPRNKIVQFLYMATEPLLRIIRGWLPTNLRYFPIDIAFLVLLALVLFSQFAIAKTLIDIGYRMNQPVVQEQRF